MAIEEKALGPSDRNVATTLNDLAALYTDQSRYTDAEPLLKRSLAIRERALGPDRPDVVQSHNNLAVLYIYQGRYGDAEALFKRVLAAQEKVLGPDHPEIAKTLHNLAGLYRNQGRVADAELLFKQSLARSEKVLGPDHREVATTMNNLASLYRGDQGRYADALALVRTTARNGFGQKNIHLAVLDGAATTSLISVLDALDESYQVVQQSISSAASTAVNQLSVRFAAGDSELAQLVRREQDLSG